MKNIWLLEGCLPSFYEETNPLNMMHSGKIYVVFVIHVLLDAYSRVHFVHINWARIRWNKIIKNLSAELWLQLMFIQNSGWRSWDNGYDPWIQLGNFYYNRVKFVQVSGILIQKSALYVPHVLVVWTITMPRSRAYTKTAWYCETCQSIVCQLMGSRIGKWQQDWVGNCILERFCNCSSSSRPFYNPYSMGLSVVCRTVFSSLQQIHRDSWSQVKIS